MPVDKLPLHVRVRIETRQAALERKGYKSYREYLRSPHWLDTRRAYYASELPQRCMCGEADIDLHHMTYERIGSEELTDLVPLCRRCHQMVHALERRGVITLDFVGFESMARAMEYAETRADRAALTSDEWEDVRDGRAEVIRRERSRYRRQRHTRRLEAIKMLKAAGVDLQKRNRPAELRDVMHATEADIHGPRSFDP